MASPACMSLSNAHLLPQQCPSPRGPKRTCSCRARRAFFPRTARTSSESCSSFFNNSLIWGQKEREGTNEAPVVSHPNTPQSQGVNGRWERRELTLGYLEKLGCEGHRRGNSLRTGNMRAVLDVYIWVGKWPWIGLYLNDPEWEDEVVPDCWLLCVCVCVCACICVCVCFSSLGDSRMKTGLKLLLRGREEECDWRWIKRITIERLAGIGNNILMVTLIYIAMGFSLGELLHSYIYSFIQQILMNSCHAPSTILGLQDTVMNKTDKVAALKELKSSWKASSFKWVASLI